MSVALWAIVVGLLLIAMAISTSLLNRSGVAEVVVLASLFTSGLKLRAPLVTAGARGETSSTRGLADDRSERLGGAVEQLANLHAELGLAVGLGEDLVGRWCFPVHAGSG